MWLHPSPDAAWDFCFWRAWNWLNAPTRLSCREWEGLLCSAIRSDRGAGRNSSISTYSRFHIFSTSFVGRVGSPFATKYLVGFGPDFSDWLPLVDREVNHGMRGAKGFCCSSGICCCPGTSLDPSPSPRSTSADGILPNSLQSPKHRRVLNGRGGLTETWPPAAAPFPFRPRPILSHARSLHSLSFPSRFPSPLTHHSFCCCRLVPCCSHPHWRVGPLRGPCPTDLVQPR